MRDSEERLQQLQDKWEVFKPNLDRDPLLDESSPSNLQSVFKDLVELRGRVCNLESCNTLRTKVTDTTDSSFGADDVKNITSNIAKINARVDKLAQTQDTSQIMSALLDANDVVEYLDTLTRDVEQLRNDGFDSDKRALPMARATSNASEYSTKSFKQFMKQEVCLLTKTRSAVYVFYNKLQHLCCKYNILLKDLTQLTYDGDIHECGSMANKIVRDQMSAGLYHKLELPGCLPCDNKRIESLLYSYGQQYDGFNLL